MKKIYVIGTGTGLDAIEKAKKILELKSEEVEMICVESMEDIPFNERISDTSIVQQIHELKALPIVPKLFVNDKKRKGHERPYKYHR